MIMYFNVQAEARLKQDIQAAKTVAMAVVTYFICYGPAILYAVLRGVRDDAASSRRHQTACEGSLWKKLVSRETCANCQKGEKQREKNSSSENEGSGRG